MRARGHFPTEQAALKCLYLAILSLDPTGAGRQRWSNRWKGALNAFDITFGEPPQRGTQVTKDKESYTVKLTDPSATARALVACISPRGMGAVSALLLVR